MFGGEQSGTSSWSELPCALNETQTPSSPQRLYFGLAQTPILFPSGLIKKRSLDQVRHLKQVFDEAKHNLIGESNTNPVALWICHGFEWVKRYTSETGR